MLCSKKEFYLTIVRHGQTIANELKTVQGHSNTALTKLGISQAEALANYFKTVTKTRFDRCFSSDLSRALNTCKIIVNAWTDSRDLKIIGDVRLRERKYGQKFEGKPISRLLQEAYQSGYDENNFTNYTPEGVESMEEVSNKVAEFCYTTLSNDCQDGDEVLLVTHWGTIKEILKLFQSKANGQIRKEHLKEAANSAFFRFKICCNQTSSPSTTSPKDRLQSGFLIDNIQVIGLHQTPHLNEESYTVNMRQRLE